MFHSFLNKLLSHKHTHTNTLNKIQVTYREQLKNRTTEKNVNKGNFLHEY